MKKFLVVFSILILLFSVIITIHTENKKVFVLSKDSIALNEFNNAKNIAVNCVDLYKLVNKNEFNNIKAKLYDTFSTTLQNEYFKKDLDSEITSVKKIKILNVVGEKYDEKEFIKNNSKKYFFKIDVELIRNNQIINKCMLVTIEKNKVTDIQSIK
ncbi:hypothetical protein [Clostridioides difficile]|uniref:hypothetical protein n=1 Tax=Clostridioides difficile TaxID=1496 RepID=UPI00038CB685|nr:hypothetical protein [Clostridioides difficile]EQF29695.1 hypothetical protein QEW_4642 [Clostridioides difficile CD160]MDM9944003.1 hypothetical protein [Clostridioides difficile]